MDIETKAQLDVLMEKFMWLQTDADSQAFDAQWRVFFASLNKEDAKIAVTAWFDTIKENLAEINKLVDLMSNEDKIEFAESFAELKNHPFFHRNFTR